MHTSRNELLSHLKLKQEENVKYYEEIQRYSEFLKIEQEKSKKIEMELQELKSKQEIENESKDSDVLKEEISKLNEELAKKDEKVEQLTNQNEFLKQKCEVFRNSVNEKEQTLSKELERLRGHLLEVEESYTQELVRAQQKNEEMLAKVNEIEQREKNSSTMYTSISIRANQQVETLQNQLQLVTNQRDELRKKISDAEDQISKQTAALTNLQFVLEQFQKGKKRYV